LTLASSRQGVTFKLSTITARYYEVKRKMIAGVAFDLYAGQFSVGEAATILKMKPSVLAMQVQRGLISPTRREVAAGSRKKRERQGKTRLSLRELMKVDTQNALASMGFSLTESVPVGDKMKRTTEHVAARLFTLEAIEVADRISTTGEWMWAMARSIERGKPFYIYAYAARQKSGWELDMYIENPGVVKPSQPPCFGWDVPHIYLPVSAIFTTLYSDSKKVLGLS
jgi:hypothetical protein